MSDHVAICSKTNKRRYESRSEASHARAGLKIRKKRKKSSQSIYHCDACGGYHLGRRNVWKGGGK